MSTPSEPYLPYEIISKIVRDSINDALEADKNSRTVRIEERRTRLREYFAASAGMPSPPTRNKNEIVKYFASYFSRSMSGCPANFRTPTLTKISHHLCAVSNSTFGMVLRELELLSNQLWSQRCEQCTEMRRMDSELGEIDWERAISSALERNEARFEQFLAYRKAGDEVIMVYNTWSVVTKILEAVKKLHANLLTGEKRPALGEHPAL